MFFHAQVGARVRHGDALRVASSMFYDGMAHFSAGRLQPALEAFEMALAINEKCAAGAPNPRRRTRVAARARRTPRHRARPGRYLTASASGCVLCCNHIAAVHDRMGNLPQAARYYERSRAQLRTGAVPKGERGVLSRRKRADLLKHVEARLEMMPRSERPKVGAGVPREQVCGAELARGGGLSRWWWFAVVEHPSPALLRQDGAIYGTHALVWQVYPQPLLWRRR